MNKEQAQALVRKISEAGAVNEKFKALSAEIDELKEVARKLEPGVYGVVVDGALWSVTVRPCGKVVDVSTKLVRLIS